MFTFVILPVKYGRAFRHARQFVGKPVPVIPGSAPRALASLRDAAPYKQFAVPIRRARCPHPAAQNAKAPAISGGLRAGRLCPCRAVAHRADRVVRPYKGTSRTPFPTNDRLFRQTGGCAFRHARLAFSLLLEAVLQGYAAVEHQMLRRAVPVVQAEIAHPHELERRRVDAGAVLLFVELRRHLAHLRLHLAAGEHRQALRVQAGQEVLVRAVGLLVGEQVVV